MTNWTRTAGLLFLSASAVYSFGVNGVKAADPADDAGAAATTVPATAPAPVEEKPEKVASNQPGAMEIHASEGGVIEELVVRDAELPDVLHMLSVRSRTNILPSKEVKGRVTANLYNVTVRQALDAILRSNGCGYVEKGNVIYVYTDKEMSQMHEEMVTRVFRLYYTPAANAMTVLKPVLSQGGQISTTTAALAGVTASDTDSGGDNHAALDLLVVHDTPKVMDEIVNILKEVDQRPQQVLIEATILSAELSEDNELGIDFTLLGGVDFQTLLANGSSAADALAGTILGNTSAAPVLHSGFFGGGTGFNQNIKPGGLQLGIVGNNAALFVQALESVTNTVIVANPKVLVLNKQRGEVTIGQHVPYLGSTTLNQSGVSQQSVDFIDIGTKLLFRPYIGDDGYIRLEIHPEESSSLGASSAQLPPITETTKTTSNIMVKDGHTVVIAGMFHENNKRQRSQVPGIGGVPGIGALFRSQADTVTRDEVIILLTPHIIKDDSAYSHEAQAAMKEVERMRVGARRGMMPFGNERLADCYYEQAVDELNSGSPNRQKALWLLYCATDLNPTFIEAAQLRERVTGKTLAASDNTEIRRFVEHAILADRLAEPATRPAAAGRPVGAEPAPTTRPVAIAAPATQPSAAQPSVAATQASPAPVAVQKPATNPTSDNNSEAVGAPATRPSMTVTELPLDEVNVEVKTAPDKSDK